MSAVEHQQQPNPKRPTPFPSQRFDCPPRVSTSQLHEVPSSLVHCHDISDVAPKAIHRAHISHEHTPYTIVREIKSVSAASAYFCWVDAIESTELDDRLPLPSP
jgi:hypothetical protein